MDNEIKLGFWNYLPVGTISPEIADKWDDLGCNLFMSFRFVEGESSKEEMIALLDKAHSLGKKVIINDERNEYLRLNKMSKEEFIKGVKESIADFGSHPATFGFYGGDEPFKDQEENFAYTMALLKELCPDKMHYGNLLPYWSDLLGEPGELNREDSYYDEKIERLIKDGKLDILAFDQYTQCYDSSKDQAKGIKQFVNAMVHFMNLANKHNIPLYVSLLAIGHYSYREPSEYDIRWQMNLVTALGAKGIIWFYFHQTIHDFGYFNPPFLGERALITPMYGKIQRQHYVFNERYKKILDQVDIFDFSLFGGEYGDSNEKLNKKYIKRLDIRDKNTLNLISYGRYRDNPKHKIAILMNANQEAGNAFSIFFHDGSEKHFDLVGSDMRIFDLGEIDD